MLSNFCKVYSDHKFGQILVLKTGAIITILTNNRENKAQPGLWALERDHGSSKKAQEALNEMTMEHVIYLLETANGNHESTTKH